MSETKGMKLGTAAGFAGLAAGSVAYGNIVVTGVPADLAPNGTTAFDTNTVTWDVDGDAIDDLRFGFRGVPISPGTYEWQANVYTMNGASVAGYTGLFVTYYGSNLGAGVSVAGSGLVGAGFAYNIAMGSDYASTAYGGFGGVGTTQNGYIGFQLGNGNYGWVEVNVGPGGYEFIGAAYDDMGNDILTGQIPAPASVAAMAMGAAGLLRRKRSA